MVNQRSWNLNGPSKLFVALIVIALGILREPVYTKLDVETVPRQITQTVSAHTREIVQIVTGTTTLHQKIVQSIRTYCNYTEIKYSSKYLELKMKIVSLNCQSWTTAKDSV